MRYWEVIGGGTCWALTAILMISAALQPVEIPAAGVAEATRTVSLCADGSASPVTGCERSHL
jgi:hypothetical protein